MKRYIQTLCNYPEIQARLEEFSGEGYKLAAALPLTFSDYENWQMPQAPYGSLAAGVMCANVQPLRGSSLTSALLIFEIDE